MTFDDRARIDSSHVKRRSGGARGGVIAGGVGGGAIIVLLLSMFLGVDLNGLLGGVTGGQGSGTSAVDTVVDCQSGADANASMDCRMAGAADSLDTYWTGFFADGSAGVTYRSTEIVLFDGQVQTGCGSASSQMGPFYCPSDETIYIDTSFYDELATSYGSSGGPLAQMYVVAHEWGHHIQNIAGIMNGLDLRSSGPRSDGVRLELQADCFAGAWVGAAASTTDVNGVAFLEPVTQQQIDDALSAASAVGDDHIQETLGGGHVNPETWTHGSSESRQNWFLTGLQNGPQSCNTFADNAAL